MNDDPDNGKKISDKCVADACGCSKKCLTNAEYLYEFFKSRGLIEKAENRRAERKAKKNIVQEI